jgi:hypothetical protein
MFDTSAQIIAALLIGYVVDMRLDPRDEGAVHPLTYGTISTVGLLVCLGPTQEWFVSMYYRGEHEGWLNSTGWAWSWLVYLTVATLAILLLLRIGGILPPGNGPGERSEARVSH